ncbi:unnamed protein product [Soboliphyme baturini]|uniref:Uncharacterized protein n=1 Tax=Soboliphyme baturini TaxID=241478 RepID=A0A183IXK5_9BILA|nr:unnamed protein product [Soboliphyme baturini]
MSGCGRQQMNVSETKSLVVYRSPARCALQISEEGRKEVRKCMYLRIIFVDDGKFEEQIHWRIGMANGVMCMYESEPL